MGNLLRTLTLSSREPVINDKQDLIKKVGHLYEQFTTGLSTIDALLAFYMELYAHCDGSMLELICT